MRDRVLVRLGFMLLLLITLACNAFAGQRGAGLPPPPNATITPVALASPTFPALAPTVTLPAEATPSENQARVRILVDLNIRSGPGVNFERVGFLLRNDRAVVIGRDPVSGWWHIECPPDAEGETCWVSGGTQYTLPEPAE